MQDMQTYLETLHRDAVDCALISKRATEPHQKELFDRVADHLAMLASESGTCDRSEASVHASSLIRCCGNVWKCG
jgi:hypothetical protein